MSPATSVPGVNGGGILIWYLPRTSSASTKSTAAARTPTTTWSARGCGSGASCTTRLSDDPISLQTTLRMARMLRAAGGRDVVALLADALGDHARAHEGREHDAAHAHREHRFERRGDDDETDEHQRRRVQPETEPQPTRASEKVAPIACANRLGGPGTGFGATARRGVTTRVTNWPSGLKRRAARPRGPRSRRRARRAGRSSR